MLFLSSTGILTGQQTWVPPGADWHYGFDRADPWLNYGYIEIKAIGDTVILGKTCRILDQIQVRYNTWYPTPGFDTTSLGQVYTYADSTKVYTYKNNRFYTLYDFGASVGTVWTVCWYGQIPPDTGQVKVDAIDYSVINGDTLKTLYVSRVNGSCIGWHSAIILERLGCINEYIFPDYDVSCIMDVQINGYFRCYLDHTFPLYSVNNTDTICEYIYTGTEELDKDKETLNITPNPAVNYLSVESSEPGWKISRISLFTIQGKKVLECIQNDGLKSEIDVSSIYPGLYVLNVINEQGVQIRKKVIIE